MTSATIREIPGITNPITHAGRVAYNARRDFLETRRRLSQRHGQRLYGDDFGDSENHSIQQYELCMRSRKDRYRHFAPNDTDLSVFSSANGLIISAEDAQNANTLQERVELVRDRLEFAGIASNRAIYDPNNNANEEGLAVQVGGLQTIYNNSDQEIMAGDIVLWDMPKLDSVHGRPINRFPGVPHEKKLFATVPYKSDILKNQLMDMCNANGSEVAVSQFLKLHNTVQRRVIGKALSTARPGQPFDILLGRYCV